MALQVLGGELGSCDRRCSQMLRRAVCIHDAANAPVLCSLVVASSPPPTFLCSFEPVLRRAVTELVRLVEPEYLATDGEPKEFFVAFFNMGSQLR